MNEPLQRASPLPDEPPPFGGRWAVLYAVVVLALAVVIAMLLGLTEHYR